MGARKRGLKMPRSPHVQQVIGSYKGLQIVLVYTKFMLRAYQKSLRFKPEHRIFKEKFQEAIFDQVRLFNDAAKTTQISKIHIADSGVATLQEFLLLAVNPDLRLISIEEYRSMSENLSESGAMLGAWLNGRKDG